MATFLRTWSYQYPWLYNAIARLAALGVGGEAKFRQLALQNLVINQNTQVLDLCCGAGQTTKFLVKQSAHVTGLDVSPVALARAKQNVPEAKYIEGLAQDIPLPDNQFELIHTSSALHEMTPQELEQIFQEVYRVLQPGGIFTLVDFHQPHNRFFWLPLAIFLWLFETETAWQLLRNNLRQTLTKQGFTVLSQSFYAGGSLQVIQAQKQK